MTPKVPRKVQRSSPRTVAALEALRGAPLGSLSVREIVFAVYKDGEPSTIKEGHKLIRRLAKYGYVYHAPGWLTQGSRVTLTPEGASHIRSLTGTSYPLPRGAS